MYKAKLSSFMDGFLDLTSDEMSPEIFCRWSAVCAVAGALERKIWVYTAGSNLYPNLYVTLVAPPGVGKTNLTKTVNRLWAGMPGHYTASNSLTAASIVDELRDATRTLVAPGMPLMEFNSLKICANELGVLLPDYTADFMNKLTDIYDGHPYGERRRGGEGKNTFMLAHPQINLLAATTPGYMVGTIPDAAWDQGFLSRTILVFSGERRIQSLFKERAKNEKLYEALQYDLIEIGKVYGELRFSPKAAAAIDKFNATGGRPTPTHPRLIGYNSRRTAHMLKLMQVMCVLRNEEHIIELIDYQDALALLLEAESYMPDIFKAMASSVSDGRIIEDAWDFIFRIWIRNKQPVPKAKLYAFLQNRTPAYNIAKVIEIMIESEKIKVEEVNKVGTCFVPNQLAE